MKAQRIRKLREKIEHLEKQKKMFIGQKYCDLLKAIVNAQKKLNELLYPKRIEL